MSPDRDTERSVKGWSRIAGAYSWQLPLERRAIRTLVDLLEITPDDELLDVATGTGAVPLELAASRPRPLRVTAVDFSSAMLARVPTLPCGWTLERADARALPFDDESFDVATTTYLLHLLDQGARAQVLDELHRVLRPGGRLGVVTTAPARSPAGQVLRWPTEAIAGKGSGPRAGLRGLDPDPVLRARGFEPMNGRRVTRGYPSLCVVARRLGMADRDSTPGLSAR